MSIRRFFRPKDGLPDPRGSLSLSVPSEVIALANREVKRFLASETETGKKRGQYKRWARTANTLAITSVANAQSPFLPFSSLQRSDHMGCGAPSRTPGLLQWLPPIFLCIHGTHECNTEFLSPPWADSALLPEHCITKKDVRNFRRYPLTTKIF